MADREFKKLDDDELASLIEGEIEDAKDLFVDSESDLATAIDYYNGVMDDLEVVSEGRSSVVITTIAEAVEWLHAGLMRIFTSTDKLFLYQPNSAASRKFAKEATDYINHKFFNKCNGYVVLNDVIHDALLLRNGILKHWWDPTPEKVSRVYDGLTDEALAELAEKKGTKIVQHSQEEIPQPPDPVFGPVPPIIIHSVRCEHQMPGKMCVEALPREDFLIDRFAKSINDARFVAHRFFPTRSDLIARGYDKDLILSIPSDTSSSTSGDDLTEQARRLTHWTDRGKSNEHDPSMDQVEAYECYVRADVDGDGIAEWRYVLKVGAPVGKGSGNLSKGATILENEEWEDDHPFTDIVVQRMPHRFEGRSVYDVLRTIQRVNTVLTRQMLDNMYVHNLPQRKYRAGGVTAAGMMEMLNPTFGGAIELTDMDAVEDMEIPFFGKDALPILEFFNTEAEKRTGVSRATQALNADALNQQKTATQAMIDQGAQYSKQEQYGRTLSEMGFKRLGRCLLRLYVKHQTETEEIPVGDEFKEVNPSEWDPEMDLIVSVGLGTGSREKDLMALQMIGVEQEKIVATLGVANPVVTPTMIRNRLARQVETANIRSPELYFAEITPDMEKAIMEQAANQKDPKVQEAEAKIQADVMKNQADMELKKQDLEFKAQLQVQQQQVDIQHQERKLQMEMAMKSAETRASIALEREKAQAQMALRREEMLMEYELKREMIARGLNLQGDEGNIKREE